MARVALGWTAKELAEASRLGIATIQRAESGKKVTEGNLYLIQRTFEEAGLIFLDKNGGGCGVRFRE